MNAAIPKLLTVKELAEAIGRTEAQVRWMIHIGSAPKHAKLGGRIMFRESDVTAWINEAFGDPE